MTDEDRLRALVAAVADGTPVDWQRAESGAQTDQERAVVRQLRLIATLSELSRSDEGTHTVDAAGAPSRSPPRIASMSWMVSRAIASMVAIASRLRSG